MHIHFMNRLEIPAQELTDPYEGLSLFRAGVRTRGKKPGFHSIFPRDGFISALLSQDTNLLKSFLLFCHFTQADKIDPFTGAQVGNYPHETPGVIIRGRSTQFNASDVVALNLIAHNAYLDISGGDRCLIEQCTPTVLRSLDYIDRHLNEHYQFYEDPALARASDYALKVTYWKDSCLPKREDGKPAYAAFYPDLQAKYINGYRSAGEILGKEEYALKAQKMLEGLQKFFDPDLGMFVLAQDRQGPIKVIASDSLGMLNYLLPGDLSRDQLESIIKASSILETRAGYRTMDPQVEKELIDKYHANTIWPVEQSLIHKGAVKFRLWAIERQDWDLVELLTHVMNVSSRVSSYLKDKDSEILRIDKFGRIYHAGCQIQLWTIAAKTYFANLQKSEPAVGVGFEPTVDSRPHNLSRIAS